MEFGIISTPFLHIFGFQGVGTFILDPNFYDHSVSFSDMAAVPARMLWAKTAFLLSWQN